jgi:site-specific DNA recombinase
VSAVNSSDEFPLTTTGQRKRAVLYLRVSTPSQVNTDYNPEGISIPAQREAGKRKADSLEADIVDEFIEPGRTATSIDKRPAFQEMVNWVKTQKDIDYVIVYHFNRVFRDSVDAGLTKRDLKKVGTRIVSTVLDMGESPESAMVESIIHAVDQYQSQASGADIRYKMGQKVKNGGTVGQAKLGYRNVRDYVDGREIRTIDVDPERGPLVTEAFELFATGQYTATQVLKRLTAAGLTSRPTKRRPAQPIQPSTLYDLLADRYYLGYVTYDGEEYPGRHEPLVTAESFERVQRVLALHGGGGTRQRRHHHWLKGLLWCARCGRRVIITPAKGNGGLYFYFLCRGRQDRRCDQPYLKVYEVEAAVEHHYATVRLTDDFRARLERGLDDTLRDELGSLNALKRQLANRAAQLDAKESHYLDLVGEPAGPMTRSKPGSTPSPPSGPRSRLNSAAPAASSARDGASSKPPSNCSPTRRASTGAVAPP